MDDTKMAEVLQLLDGLGLEMVGFEIDVPEAGRPAKLTATYRRRALDAGAATMPKPNVTMPWPAGVLPSADQSTVTGGGLGPAPSLTPEPEVTAAPEPEVGALSLAPEVLDDLELPPLPKPEPTARCKCTHPFSEHHCNQLPNMCLHRTPEGKTLYCECMAFEHEPEETF